MVETTESRDALAAKAEEYLKVVVAYLDDYDPGIEGHEFQRRAEVYRTGEAFAELVAASLRSTSRDSEGTERQVQVYDGEGDLVLDVLVLNSMEADWLREFLEGTEAGDVYVDPVPPLRLAQSTSPIGR